MGAHCVDWGLFFDTSERGNDVFSQQLRLVDYGLRLCPLNLVQFSQYLCLGDILKFFPTPATVRRISCGGNISETDFAFAATSKEFQSGRSTPQRLKCAQLYHAGFHQGRLHTIPGRLSHCLRPQSWSLSFILAFSVLFGSCSRICGRSFRRSFK